MGELFNRVYDLSVYARRGFQPILEIQDLDLSFTVTKTITKEPNTAEFRVFNLSPNSRGLLHDVDLLVKFLAGYEETAELIFRGDVRQAFTTKQGQDIVTTITTGDGEKAMRETYISQSFAKGMPFNAALAKVAEGLDDGKSLFKGIVDYIKSVDSSDAAQKLGTGAESAGRESALHGLVSWIKGATFEGRAFNVFDDIMKSMGKTWSVQNGKLQVLDAKGGTTLDVPILLSAASGLIGSPNVGTDGLITARSLLQPGFTPGRRVQLDAVGLRGAMTRVEKVTHSGDSSGSDWFSDLELKKLA